MLTHTGAHKQGVSDWQTNKQSRVPCSCERSRQNASEIIADSNKPMGQALLVREGCQCPRGGGGGGGAHEARRAAAVAERVEWPLGNSGSRTVGRYDDAVCRRNEPL